MFLKLLESKQNFFGNDCQDLFIKSEDDCYLECLLDFACIGFSFDDSNLVCTLAQNEIENETKNETGKCPENLMYTPIKSANFF